MIRPQNVLTVPLLAGADLTLDGIDLVVLRMLPPSISLSLPNGYGPEIEGRSGGRRVTDGSSRTSAWRTLLELFNVVPP
jgi:hypothetical protein